MITRHAVRNEATLVVTALERRWPTPGVRAPDCVGRDCDARARYVVRVGADVTGAVCEDHGEAMLDRIERQNAEVRS